jgi:predicted nucleic acid-binding Zn ribbon protein
MVPLFDIVPDALAALLRHGPLSPGKLAFAWRVAVGPAIDRITTVELGADGVVKVTAPDAHWQREIRRSSAIIATRLEALLGPNVITRLSVGGSRAGGANRRKEQTRARAGARSVTPRA